MLSDLTTSSSNTVHGVDGSVESTHTRVARAAPLEGVTVPHIRHSTLVLAKVGSSMSVPQSVQNTTRCGAGSAHSAIPSASVGTVVKYVRRGGKKLSEPDDSSLIYHIHTFPWCR